MKLQKPEIKSSGDNNSVDGKKGYGFITMDEGKDVFCHFSSITGMDGFKTLSEGQRVSLSVVRGDKGDQAAEVTPID